MHIYLIRHGESTGNNCATFMGWSDHPLTALGRAQAEAVAERLARFAPLPIICSDLPRAVETAEIIAARGQGTVLADARWREFHCGQFEGRSWEEYRTDAELCARYAADPYTTVMPGGESAAMLAARVSAAFDELLARDDPGFIVVTHDGPIRAVLAHCLHVPPERNWTLATDHGGLTLLTVTDGWLSIRTVNDTSHLAAIQDAGCRIQALVSDAGRDPASP